MPFKKGEISNPKGRRKGSKNKVSADIAQIYLDVFHAKGGAKALLKFARKTENEAIFYQLIARLFPKDYNVTAETHTTYEVWLREEKAKADAEAPRGTPASEVLAERMN